MYIRLYLAHNGVSDLPHTQSFTGKEADLQEKTIYLAQEQSPSHLSVSYRYTNNTLSTNTHNSDYKEIHTLPLLHLYIYCMYSYNIEPLHKFTVVQLVLGVSEIDNRISRRDQLNCICRINWDEGLGLCLLMQD